MVDQYILSPGRSNEVAFCSGILCKCMWLLESQLLKHFATQRSLTVKLKNIQ